MSNHGLIWWSELNTWNAEKAMEYYGPIMGWTFDVMPTAVGEERPYYIAKKDGKPVAGFFTLTKPMFEGMPEHWFTHIAVDDLDAAIAHSKSLGGTVRRPPFEIPGAGRLAIVADVNGAVAGWMQPEQAAGT